MSNVGEKPGAESKIGFRGTRFSISKKNRLYLTDYQKNVGFAKDEEITQFVKDTRNVLGSEWKNGRIRIRANGDVYASGAISKYVGNVNLENSEAFTGYLNLKSSYNLSSKVPQVFAGPQTNGHPGERWTIPDNKFALRYGHKDNVGQKISRGDWIWSESSHSEFIAEMKKRLHLGGSYIRFYLTCDGLIITPIPHNHWETYGIDIAKQISDLNRIAPNAVNSIRERLALSRNRGDESHHLLFVIGHIDDLMNGEIPVPDGSDPRTGKVDER